VAVSSGADTLVSTHSQSIIEVYWDTQGLKRTQLHNLQRTCFRSPRH